MTTKKKSNAAKSQEETNKNIQDEAVKRAVGKAAKTVKSLVEFPKIATDAKIQTVVYDATTGVNVKFKDMSFTSGQVEKLVAIAQDGTARVRLTIEEINPTFDSTKKNVDDPMFDEMPEKKKDKKKSKKATKTDDGSELPV